MKHEFYNVENKKHPVISPFIVNDRTNRKTEERRPSRGSGVIGVRPTWISIIQISLVHLLTQRISVHLVLLLKIETTVKYIIFLKSSLVFK